MSSCIVLVWLLLLIEVMKSYPSFQVLMVLYIKPNTKKVEKWLH